ncbi:hypothetical protein R1flu_025559 [Riccia fluitans]|uniref:Uncharacterized protein n=1 Tax=Riccia fluitans TaxID=41844 RepID=A0ABD1XY39_9MARC
MRGLDWHDAVLKGSIDQSVRNKYSEMWCDGNRGKVSSGTSFEPRMLHGTMKSVRLGEEASASTRTICKHEGLPFVYPGNSLTWDYLNDPSSADLIAEQEIWASTTPEAKNEAFNISNGDVFRWRVWHLIAEMVGVEPAPYPGKGLCLTGNFRSKDAVWETIIREKGLVETKLKDVGHFRFADLVFNTPFEAVGSMNKSRKFGFHGFRDTEESLKAIIHEMIEARIVPSFNGRYMLRNAGS